MDDLVYHGTLSLMPETLQIGDKIMYEGKLYTVTGITSWRDPFHGKVYAFDLEAEGETRRISVVEGTELERR